MVRSNDERHTLTAPKFADLLARLHPEADQAGVEYERLRRALIRFFDWRGAWPPDECADDCLDRLARRLADGTPIADVRQFAYGIARLVLLERRRQPMMSSIDQVPAAVTAAPPPAPDDDGGPLHDCFDRCLSQMPTESRSFVLSYYDGERDRKIANRRRLSESLGVSENALRSRVQRLRDGIEVCVQACVAAADRSSS